MNKSQEYVVKLTGSPYEIGYKHGSIAKEKVHNSLETYERMFKEESGFSWKEACEKALLHVDAIETYNRNYLEEMDGLARGAAVQFEDILALNARSEIALVTSPDGCTAFSLTNPKTSTTWLAQNWDWKGLQINSLVHLKIEQKGLPTLEFITEAGIIGKIGCNSEGIGVCLNALVTDTWQPKVPIHLGLRAVLESSSIEEVITKVGYNQMASPAHFLVASADEKAASLEVSPIHTAVIESTNGKVTHTNHLCSLEMKNRINERTKPDSFSRFSTMNSLLDSLNETELDEDHLFQILSNHHNYPYSICRHKPNEPNDAEPYMETVFSVVMNLTQQKLWWVKGKPCERKLS
ncbi:MAG TPA: C45 family peptidase [Bacillus sp. (in: firmicutes)]|nr:C45 family peptidase [Bacillus sp. (in: firmicutes)]